jgi:hypothetical protein
MNFQWVCPRLKFVLLILSAGTAGLFPLRAQSPVAGGSPRPSLQAYVSLKHGTDQELINGRQFTFMHYRIQGHPYFMGQEPLAGGVTLSGRQYGGLRLNYDIYDQHLVMEYTLFSSGINKIVLSPLLADAFTIGGFDFEKISLDEKGPLYYQVIRSGNLACYVHWEKQLTPTQNSLQYLGHFTDPIRTCFLEYGGGLHPFRSRKSFAAIFTENTRREIKRYMRVNGIRFRAASPGELTTLIDFVSGVLQKTTEN